MSSMMLEIMPYVILTAGLSLSVLLFVLTKGEILRQGRKSKRDRGELELTIMRLNAEMALLRDQVSAPTETPFAPVRPSLNLNRRTQVIRMSRRGDRPDQIASALGVPQNEVELLLKLQQTARTATA